MSPDGPEHDDTDTGPVNVVAPPPPGEGAWTNYFDSSVLVPRPVPDRRRRRRRLVAGAAAAVVLTALAAVGFWAFRPSPSTPESPQADAAGESAETSPVPDPEAETRLLRLIPPGYPAGACSAVAPPNGALAKLDCVKNADSGGPTSGSYTLLPDKKALATAFDGYVDGIGVVNCPRNMQSPGPWRRNATPQLVSGTLVCGFVQNRPTVAWTDDVALVLNTTESVPPGPGLDQLYDWWSTHS